ncbi:DUF3800 domain-containing protein [Brachyspira alvinipulli]|uniref:DUF3800 domain-containing protein n=1 Tax=Brachyspira alvinipulli TaxID=84379 RepID=UPI0004811AE9
MKDIIQKLFCKKKIREENEKMDYIKNLLDVNLDNIINDNSNFPFMYLFSSLIYLFDDESDIKKDIINIVLFENKQLITFRDVFSILDNNSKGYILELLTKAKENKIDDDNIKRIISNIDILDDKLIINSLTDEDLLLFKNKATDIVLKEKDKKNNEENNYIDKYLQEVFNLKIENNNFPLIYLLAIFKHSVSSEKLYSFCNKINVRYEIMDLLFSDLRVYNLYMDESGNINDNRENVFIIGGYLINDINMRKWNNITKNYFDILRHKFRIFDDTLLHRNELEKNKKKAITYDVFRLIKINGGKFIYVYEKNPFNIDFTRQYYVDLLSDLVIKTLNKIISDDKINLSEEKLLLIIKLSSRSYEDKYKSLTFKFKDVENFLMSSIENAVNINDILDEWKKQNMRYLSNTRYLEILDIEPFIKDGIEKIKINYGLNSKNLEYSILPLTNATKDTDLVIADYFCNMFYSFKHGNGMDTGIFTTFLYLCYLKIKYNPFSKDIDLYLEKKDYFNILSKYITFRKIYFSNN